MWQCGLQGAARCLFPAKDWNRAQRLAKKAAQRTACPSFFIFSDLTDQEFFHLHCGRGNRGAGVFPFFLKLRRLKRISQGFLSSSGRRRRQICRAHQPITSANINAFELCCFRQCGYLSSHPRTFELVRPQRHSFAVADKRQSTGEHIPTKFNVAPNRSLVSGATPR